MDKGAAILLPSFLVNEKFLAKRIIGEETITPGKLGCSIAYNKQTNPPNECPIKKIFFSLASNFTISIKRTISLIIEASKSGGNVADVLDVAARDAREIKLLEAERKANMLSYVVVIYVGMFVFLAIILILCTSFIPAMVGSEGSEGMQGVMGGGSVASQAEIVTVFYFACLVQGFGSAAVAGVFEDGSFTSSVKHVFIMVLISWLAFKLLLGV